MSLKNLTVALSFCSLFALSSAQDSFAENAYCSGVEVIFAGSHSLGKIVNLKNTRTDCGNWALGSTLFFLLDDSTKNANAMLAAALSAQASGGTVLIVPIDGSQGGIYSNYSTLTALYAGK